MARDNESCQNAPEKCSKQIIILNNDPVTGLGSRSQSHISFGEGTDVKNNTKKFPSSQAVFTKPRTFDDLLDSIGGFGTFQWLALVLLLSPEIPAAFVTFSPVFTGRTPSQWQCISNATSQSSNSIWLSSAEACDCQGKLVSADSSIVSEWSLLCGSSWVSDFVTSIQMLGMLTGSLTASQISDWFGRKRIYLGVCFLMAFGQLLSSIAPNPILYGIARFICGAGISGFMGLSTIYPMEFLTPKYRMLTGGVGPWGEGIMLLALLAHLFTEWRTLVWITALPFLFVFISVPFLPESPRWLLRNQRLEEAVQAIKTIQRINSASFLGKQKSKNEEVHVTQELLEKIAQEELQQQSGSTTRFSYAEFFRNDTLRRKTLLLMGIWCSWALVYFGVSYNIKNLGGDIYVNMGLLGLSDAVGYRTSLLLCNRIGRRKSLILFMALGAAFLVLLAVSDVIFVLTSTAVIILCFIGKIGVAAARSAARMLTGESFPTPVRTMGYGITGVAAGIGGIISPQIVLFGSLWWSPLPFVTFGVLSVLGSILSLLLPETAGQSLQDTVEVTSHLQTQSKHERKLDEIVDA